LDRGLKGRLPFPCGFFNLCPPQRQEAVLVVTKRVIGNRGEIAYGTLVRPYVMMRSKG
jgi:hypothetical protein